MNDSDNWLTELKNALATEFARAPMVCTLATVDEHGLPSARSVICRRIEETGELLFVSDARSRKNEHLAERPAVEVVFWLPAARVQYRITGTVGIVRAGLADDLRASLADDLRNDLWRQLSDKSRALFFWPPGGEPLQPDPDRFPHAIPQDTAPPATFEILLLRPTAADIVEITHHPHRRRLCTRTDTGWKTDNVNP